LPQENWLGLGLWYLYNATFNNISVLWVVNFIGGENHRPVAGPVILEKLQNYKCERGAFVVMIIW
jgi:hypothetical protein